MRGEKIVMSSALWWGWASFHGTQISSNQVCYFADVQKPPSENMPVVSFPPLSPCCAAGEHCGIAGARRVLGLPLSVLRKHLTSPVFSAAA